MTKQKKSIFRRISTFLMVTALVLYIGYQTYRSVFSAVETELAVQHSMYESIETKGFVFRTETLVPTPTGGYLYYSIENGTRVAKNSVIASVYSAPEHGRIQQQMTEIDEKIAALKTIQADGSSGRVTLDVLNEQLGDEIYSLINDGDSGVFTELENTKFSLLSVMSKKQIITGETVDFKKKIADLQKEKSSLKKHFKAAKSVVRAPVAGYFADKTDGFEKAVDINKLDDITVKQLQEYLASEPKAVSDSGGKIVSGYVWYMGCVVPDSYYNVLGVGRSLSIRMSFVTDEAVPVTVHACNKDNNGNLAVVFRCDYMSAELSTIRNEPVQIQLVRHEGLKVPKRAIIIDENQQTGVYVRSGNVASFRKIKQIFSEPADYVICEEVGESGYLRMFDDIIVGGRGLYDGKIIG